MTVGTKFFLLVRVQRRSNTSSSHTLLICIVAKLYSENLVVRLWESHPSPAVLPSAPGSQSLMVQPQKRSNMAQITDSEDSGDHGVRLKDVEARIFPF